MWGGNTRGRLTYRNPNGSGQPMAEAVVGRERLTVYDVANGFQTGATHGPFVGVQCVRFFVKPKEEHIATDIENRVDTRR